MKSLFFRFIFVFVTFSFVSLDIIGQEGSNGNSTTVSDSQQMTWEQFVERMMAGFNDEVEESEIVDDELLSTLHDLCLNPMNINEATKEDLLVLPFVNEEKANDIIAYLEKNSPMQSYGEFLLIPTLTKEDREMLRLFVAPPSADVVTKKTQVTWQKLMKCGKNELIFRSDIPFYIKDGYRNYPDSVLERYPNKVYRGDRFHHALRYSFSSMNHLFAGLQIEKDAGERGVDYLSGYVMVKDVGIVKRAVVGDYKVNFGHGLAINTSMKYGKMMMCNTADKMDAGITKHSSASEANYFTGAATTIVLGDWQFSAFGSYRKVDGTMRNDTIGIASLKTDGLHRTTSEHSKRQNVVATNLGGNIHWGRDALKLSATLVSTHFDKPLTPIYNTPASLYRLYNAEGQDFIVGSFAYMYRLDHLAFSGETAYSHCDKQNGMATLNSLCWKADENNILTLVGRYYQAKFVSINGKAFGENSAVQNEEGLFLGWMSKSLNNTQINAYVDAMYFPWMKYKVGNSSYGIEGMIQATYSKSQKWNMLVRYRVKSKQADSSLSASNSMSLSYKTNQNIRIQLNNTLSPSISLRTTLSGTLRSFSTEKNEMGFSLGENIRWQHFSNNMHIDLGVTYFNTDSYDARVFGYEPSLIYSLGYTSYYYKGMRGVLMASIPMCKSHLVLNAKCGITKYFNKDDISSGTERIAQNHREDLQIQLRYKF